MKIKSLLLVIFALAISAFSAIGQNQINPNSKEYQLLKENGKLKIPEQINFTGQYPEVKSPVASRGLLVPLDGTFSIALAANDDGYTDQMQLPFAYTFYGELLSNFYINNNGNISFGEPYSTYTSTGFPIADFPMLAPFWADVDTRGIGSGLVHYRIEPNRLVVIWDHVGYYGSHWDKLNTFELIVTDGTDPLIGIGNNVAFCYEDMQWTTGDASNGNGGFGGTPATVGINKGDGSNFALIGRFDHAGTDYDGPGGNADGVSYLDNKCFFFNTGVEFNNIPPIAQGVPAVQPVELMVGDIYNLTVSFLSPEETQITDAVVNSPAGLTDFDYTVTPGNVCIVVIELTAANSNIGLHEVEIIATDDGIPPESTTVTIDFNIMSLDPVITVNPTSLFESLYPDETSTQILTISNTGDADLVFDLEDLETSRRFNIKSMKMKGSTGDNSDDFINYLNGQMKNGFKSVREVGWLSEDPLSGTVAPGESLEIEVGFDATALVPDIYNAQIVINSNDPVNAQVAVPVTLEVMTMNCSFLTTNDNENNAIQGIPDYDMDEYLYNDDAIAPIEFNIFIAEANVETAQLNMYAWDVDEINGEIDEVYVNGNLVGTLTGADDEWSTSVFNIDPAFINPGPEGKNLIQVFIDVLNPPPFSNWAVNVDWGQMIINGCNQDAYIRYVNLDKALYQQGETVDITVEVDTEIPTQSVKVETNLLDENMVNVAGTSNTFTINGTEDEPLVVTLPIPMDANLGATYQAQVIVYDAGTNIQQDLLLTPFLIWDGSGQCMNPGWQIISSWLEPTDPALEVMMSDLVDNNTLAFMLNNDGVFWPSQNINTIGNWDSHSAYKIKMAAFDCLSIDGEMVEDKSVTLEAGINFTPVLSDEPVPANDIFAQLGDAMLYAFDIQDQLVYWPEGGIYTLSTLEPGRGYVVNMLEEGTVTFPATTKSFGINLPNIIQDAPWSVYKTGTQHIISISSLALSELEQGDIIGVFNTNGVCTGMSQYQKSGENLALVVWGDDFTTDEVDGMIAGEQIDLVAYSPVTGEENTLIPLWNKDINPSNLFAENGVSMISSFKNATSVDESNFELISIYPNPNNGLFMMILKSANSY